ncbi:hypothetical protein ACF0H5_020937 [Mactra antiquata]
MKIVINMFGVSVLALFMIPLTYGENVLSIEDRLTQLEKRLADKDNDIQDLQQTVETLTRQMTTMSEALVKTFYSGKGIGNITGEEHVQKSLRPRAMGETVAFYAYLSAPKCFGNHETVVFDTEITDTGLSYNVQDGIFDVPITGTYIFTLTVVPVSQAWVTYQIVSNGHVIGGAVGDSEDNASHHSGSITVAVNLQVGDHVFVRKGSGSNTCATHSSVYIPTSFAGWLIN